jgi:hypothetical protein
MRIVLYSSFLLLLCLTAGFAEPTDPRAELKKYEDYGSRLAYAKYQMLSRKEGLEPDWDGRWNQSGYGLFSDVYGGMYSPLSRREGELDLYTGRKAVQQSVATDSIRPTLDADGERSLSISEIEPVTVRSHPWTEMLEEVKPGPELSSLFQLAPEDCFVVYFKQGSTIGNLERGLQSLVEGADVLFNFQQSISASEMIARRLGVENFRELEPLMGETLFISEDLDFYPNTHYALVFKGDSLSKIGANLLLESEAQGRVGDAFVLATSKELFKRIEQTQKGEISSLAQADDLKYCNAVLDHQRDGFCYLSEAFISKMVFPAYRINSARRLAAIEDLVERQYSVLAYRTITSEWPKSFEQMMEEDYLGSNPDAGDFSIDAEGRVKHKVWGSVWDLKALSEVPVQRVSEIEKNNYDDFRSDYDRLWTRFFDPVGLAFEVKEELRFHTIILPLVNSREYGFLNLISGGEPIDFKTLSYPYLQSPASLHSKFNFENAVLSVFENISSEADAEARAKARNKMNQRLRSRYDFDESFDLFKVFGDEVCVSYGEDVQFQGWEQLDLVLSLELKDEKRFRELGQALMPEVKREKKLSHGVEYFAFHFSIDSEPSFYAIYQGGFVHFTMYQPALERFCRQLSEPKEQDFWFDSQWVGAKHNVLFRADLRKSSTLLVDALDPSRNYYGRRQMSHAVGYAVDSMLGEESLSKDEMEKFFRHPPRSLYGIPISVKDGQVYLGDALAQDVDLQSYYSYHSADQELEKDRAIRLVDLVKKHRSPATLEKMKLFEQASVGMSFTPEGLSTRVSINNPAYKPDALVLPIQSKPSTLMWGAGGLGALLLGLTLLRRKKPNPRQDIVS